MPIWSEQGLETMWKVTLENIYDALDKGVESPQAFRNRLLRENDNRDENDVRNLFEAYFWN